jgi:O-antigen ligase
MSQHGFVTFAMRGFSYSAWGVTGSPGWFRNAGDFGIAMAIFVPLILSFILALQENWGRYKRWVFYFVAITAAVSILASSSRGAQLGIIATALWFVLKSKKAVKAILIAAVVGVIVYFSLSDEMLAEYRDMGGDSTSENRLAHWAWGSDVFKNNPVIGVGYNNWLVHCDFYNPNGVYAEGSRGRCLLPHNTYVELLAEMGSVGMLFYLLIIFYMLKQNSKTRSLVREKEDNFSFYISHGLDGALIAYLVSSVFYSVLFYPFLWINLSMTVVLYQVTKRTIEQKM